MQTCQYMYFEDLHVLLSSLGSRKQLLLHWINEPAHEIMVLITSATSEGSGEPVHPRCLARAIAVRTYEVWK